MTQPIVSIIIPAYNAEKYIEQCIESAIHQTYTQLQIIIINDGSTDATEKICSRYFDDSRISYCKIANAGVSNARNVGLSVAEGDYIFFMDADDCLTENAIESCISSALHYDADCVMMSHYEVDEQTGEKKKKQKAENDIEVLTGEDLIRRFTYTNDIGWEVWGKLFRRDVIGDTQFNIKRAIAEDALFIQQSFMKCQKCVLLKEALYLYRINAQSVMQQKFTEKNWGTIETVQDINTILIEAGYTDEAYYFRLKFYIWFLRFYSRTCNKTDRELYSDRIEQIREEIRKENNRYARNVLSNRYYMEFLFIKYGFGFYENMIARLYK